MHGKIILNIFVGAAMPTCIIIHKIIGQNKKLHFELPSPLGRAVSRYSTIHNLPSGREIFLNELVTTNLEK